LGVTELQVSETGIGVAAAPSQSGKVSAGRPLLLAGVLLSLFVVNAMVDIGLQFLISWIRREEIFPVAVWSLLFHAAGGWSAVGTAMFPLWLAWGVGRVSLRLAIVLAGCLLQCGLGALAAATEESGAGIYLISYLSVVLVVVLADQALLLPIHHFVPYRLVLGEGPAPEARSQVSILQMLVWITFASFPLAMIQVVHPLMAEIGEEGLGMWLQALAESLAGLAVVALVAIVLLQPGLAFRRKVALVGAAIVSAVALRQLWPSIRPLDSLAGEVVWLATMMLAAAANLLVLRAAGLRLVNVEQTSRRAGC
jgi:hypothetical protein